MFLSTRGLKVEGRGSMVAVLIALMLVGCVPDRQSTQKKSFYNIDSLITAQVQLLKDRELNKSVSVDTKQEETHFVPDSLQWANELDVFRQIGQVNKASFRDAYVVNEIRDTNSNLTIREIKAQGDVPVSTMKLYFLRDPNDIRKIEATLVEVNSVYTDTRKMTLEFERSHILNRYRIEGSQKMVMNDSMNFVVAGTIE